MMTPPTHFALRASWIYLAMLALIAIFADLLAAEGPILAFHSGRIYPLPALTSRAFRGRTAEQIRSQIDHGWAVWSPMRAPGVSSTSARASAGPPTPQLGAGWFALVRGTRTLVVTSLLVMGISFFGGAGLGLLANSDALLARLTELFGSLPPLVWAALLARNQVSLYSMALGLGALSAIRVMCLVRGNRRPPSSARPLQTGAPFHVLARSAGPALVNAAWSSSAVLALDAALWATGLSSQSSAFTWGRILVDASATSARWAAGLGAVLTTGALFVVAKSLRGWLEQGSAIRDQGSGVVRSGP
jgi:peptide/nickel transport system permease protein